MKRHFPVLVYAILSLTASTWATVTVTSPLNGSTVGTQVNYVATGSSSTCSKGVASMGVYINNVLTFVSQGASLNTNLTFSPGTYSNTVVEEWDYCGGATFTTVAITVTAQTGVWVVAPTNNGSVGSPVTFTATATTVACSKGVSTMGIYVNNVLTYVSNGPILNTLVSLSPGNYSTVVEEWDYCGGAAYTTVNITVSGATGSTFSAIQGSKGWIGYGELPPKYAICTKCGPGITYSMAQHITSPSMSGNATQFNIGGTTPYADVLWTNPLIGQNSSQGVPDNDHRLLPTLHNYTYDAYFYTTQLSVAQVIEMDISMYFNGASLIWGHQCRITGGNEWDIWDNVNAKWIPTGISCYPLSGAWNHVTLQVQRESDNRLLFQSITLNGVTSVINKYYSPSTAPSGWWGTTVNFQLDGNWQQAPYTVYLDNFNFTYW